MSRSGGDRRALRSTDQKRLHRDWRRRTHGRVAILLDGVMTPYNVGSVVRLAAAYGASPLWLAGATATASHPSARRTALGTERYVEIVDGLPAAEAAADATAEGFQVVGVELAAGAVPLHEADLGPDVCLAFGHEEHGLSGELLRRCDAVTYLPLVGRVGSLNVATAAGIALYEVRRREWAAASDVPGVDIDP